jgi:hypothetical protein
MSPLSQLSRVILVAHGVMNIAQGTYSLYSPKEYGALVGDTFAGTPEKALQSIGRLPHHRSYSTQFDSDSIGLGAIGVGWYELIFAYQNNRALILATIPLRFVFAYVMWTWENSGVMGYEMAVAVVCGLALWG